MKLYKNNKLIKMKQKKNKANENKNVLNNLKINNNHKVR